MLFRQILNASFAVAIVAFGALIAASQVLADKGATDAHSLALGILLASLAAIALCGVLPVAAYRRAHTLPVRT